MAPTVLLTCPEMMVWPPAAAEMCCRGSSADFWPRKWDPLTAAAFGCFVHGLAGGRGPERERGLWTFSLGYYTIHVKDYPIGRKAL